MVWNGFHWLIRLSSSVTIGPAQGLSLRPLPEVCNNGLCRHFLYIERKLSSARNREKLREVMLGRIHYQITWRKHQGAVFSCLLFIKRYRRKTQQCLPKLKWELCSTSWWEQRGMVSCRSMLAELASQDGATAEAGCCWRVMGRPAWMDILPRAV